MKYFSAEISEAYKAVEAASCQSLLDLLPADLREDYAPYLLPAGAYARYLPYLKAADRFSALVKCMRRPGRAILSSAGLLPRPGRPSLPWHCRS